MENKAIYFAGLVKHEFIDHEHAAAVEEVAVEPGLEHFFLAARERVVVELDESVALDEDSLQVEFYVRLELVLPQLDFLLPGSIIT